MTPSQRPARAFRTLDHGTIALMSFLLSAALVGGSSRFDATANVAVSAIMTVYLAYLCLFAAPRMDRRFAVPLAVVGMCIAIMLVQVVPLPPALWAALPGRADFVQPWLAGPPGWHSIAFNGPRAASSVVPLWMGLATLIGILAMPADRRPLLLSIWMLVGLLCSILGVLQVAGGEASPFYFFQRTNRGYLTGLFANRNHTAAFLAAMLPLVRAWSLLARSERQRRDRRLLATGMLVLFTASILLTGSRAGLLLLGVGLVGYYAVRPMNLFLPGTGSWSRLKPLFVVGLLVGMVTAFLINDRINGYGRLQNFDSSTELRLLFLPELIAMVTTYFPIGSGFGSFDSLFRGVEPWTSLRPTYFNNAHNDFLEILIAGGLIVILPVAITAVWISQWSWRSFHSSERVNTIAIQRAAFFGILIFSLASWVDYPLRSTTAAIFFVFLLSTGSWFETIADKQRPRNS